MTIFETALLVALAICIGAILGLRTKIKYERSQNFRKKYPTFEVGFVTKNGLIFESSLFKKDVWYVLEPKTFRILGTLDNIYGSDEHKEVYAEIWKRIALFEATLL